MRTHRITSTGGAAWRAGPWIVVAFASALVGPAAAAPPDVTAPGAGPLGSAVGMLAPHPTRGRRSRHHAAEPMAGCTGMATLDGVSAALQAGPFGRGKGLAIMQFRNVATDRADDRQVDCHSDVLLSDGSLHRAEYGLRRVRRGTRLHVEVGREAAGEVRSVEPAPAVPDAAAAAPVASPGQPDARLPAT